MDILFRRSLLLSKQKVLDISFTAVALGTESSRQIKHGTHWMGEMKEGGIKDEFRVSCIGA